MDEARANPDSQTIADSEFRIVKIPKLSVWGFWSASIFLFAAAIELIFFIGVLFVVDPLHLAPLIPYPFRRA